MVKPFDSFYSGEGFYYDLTPSEELAAFVTNNPLSSARALDLGCGEGRDSVFLATNGYTVDAVDESKAAIDKLTRFSKSHGLAINAKSHDLVAFDIIPKSYELINCTTVLDHLDKVTGLIIAERILSGVKPGGVVVVEVFTQDDPGCSGIGIASDTAQFVKHYFEPGELREWFRSLKVALYEEKREIDTSHGSPHQHAIAVLIGRRD